MTEFKYDIAFSFLAEDEHLALQFADKLRDRFRVFIYSEQQLELAGKDGVAVFSKVFAAEARVVVVLHRQRWGQTKWTRVEEEAIRGRAFEDGWGFASFIPLDEEPELPAWFPKTRIYLGLPSWGLDGACGVIEQQVVENGGLLAAPTSEGAANSVGKQDAGQRDYATFASVVKRIPHLHAAVAPLNQFAAEFAKKYEAWSALWGASEDPRWMLAYLARTAQPGSDARCSNVRGIVRCACELARVALAGAFIVREAEASHPLSAIALAEKWAEGGDQAPTIRQLHRAAYSTLPSRFGGFDMVRFDALSDYGRDFSCSVGDDGQFVRGPEVSDDNWGNRDACACLAALRAVEAAEAAAIAEAAFGWAANQWYLVDGYLVDGWSWVSDAALAYSTVATAAVGVVDACVAVRTWDMSAALADYHRSRLLSEQASTVRRHFPQPPQLRYE